MGGNIKKLILTAVMAMAMAAPAFADVTAKTESVIMHDRVTVGDVFDGVTVNADYYLAPAPAMGKTMTLNVNDLMRISSNLHLGWTPATNTEQVVIRRAANRIDRFGIQAAIQEKMTSEMKGGKVEVEVAEKSAAFTVPETANLSVDVEKMTYDAARGAFKAVVSPSSQPDMKKEVTGRFYRVVEVPVVKTALRPGDVIAASDIDYVDVRSNAVTSNMVTEASRLVGQTPRRGLTAMKPLTSSDLTAPVVVKKGDIVTMVLKRGMISLTAQGKAMQNGAAGDAIRIMNTASKQVIDAVVTGPQTVSVATPMNRAL